MKRTKTGNPERVRTGQLGACVLHSRYDSRELAKTARAAVESRCTGHLSAGAVTSDNPEAETITIPAAKLRELAEQLTPATANAIRAQLLDLVKTS